MDKGDTQTTNKMCDSCQIREERKPAGWWCFVCNEAFCDQCSRCHNTFNATAKHQIVPMAEMTTHSSSAKLDVDLKCEVHPDESINVYCVDHSHPCCTVCATLYHRKCDELVPIEKVAIGIRDSDDVVQFRQRMEKDKEGLVELLKARQECKQEFESKIQTIESEVTQTEKNVMNCIANAKEKFQKHFEEKRKGISKELSKEQAILQEYRKELENLITMFDGTLSFKSEKECFVLLTKLKTTKVSAQEEKIKASKSQLIETSIMYDARNPMEALQNIDFFGRVKTKEDMQAQVVANDPQVFVSFRSMRFLLDKETAHEEVTVSDDGATFTNIKQAAVPRTTGSNRHRNFRGVRGTHVFAKVGRYFYEVVLEMKVVSKLQHNNIAFEIGIARNSSIDNKKYIEGQPFVWSMIGAHHPSCDSVCIHVFRDRKVLLHKNLVANEVDKECKVTFGFLVNTESGTWEIFNSENGERLCVVTDVNFDVPLFPVVSGYNSSQIQVTATFVTGHESIPEWG